MKKIFIVFVLLFIPLFNVDAESISRMDVDITINKDATIDVVERILYDFGNAQRHGIYRDIPAKYKTDAGNNRSVKLSDVSVADESGRTYNYVVSTEGRNKRIKIGDAATYVTGAKTYMISYTVSGAINYFDTHDELYWNAVGLDWPVPIEMVQVTVRAPEISDVACFAGPYGSSAPCSKVSDQTRQSVVFVQANIAPRSGVTAVIGMPVGTVHKPSFLEKMIHFVLDNWVWSVPVIVFVFMWQLWSRRGKDPEGRGTVVPYYEAPEDLSPAAIGMIVDDTVHGRDVSAALVNLAVKGFMHIKKIDKKGLLSKEDYVFSKTQKDISELTDSGEKLLYEKIFKVGVTERKLSDMKNDFYKDLEKIKKRIIEDIVQSGYYHKSPQKVRAKYFVIAVLLFFVAFFAMSFSVAGGIAMIVSAGIVGGFGYLMPRRTTHGAHVRESILGLKLYMDTAEKDRIDFHNAPEKNPARFEKLLPYAMALSVEEKWAEQFKDIYNTQPEWYESSSTFYAPTFARDLSHFSSAAGSTMASRPSSASSGGSGFSGGGSGGGFGGGGGGSW